jgi:hypothetical protein
MVAEPAGYAAGGNDAPKYASPNSGGVETPSPMTTVAAAPETVNALQFLAAAGVVTALQFVAAPGVV